MPGEDGLLSRGQKYQAGMILIGLTIEALIYSISVLLNGFDYTNTLIQANLIPVIFFSLTLLAIAPVYYRTDELAWKVFKQLTFTGVILVTISVPTWIYYRFHPPGTGWERLVDRLTYIYTSFSVVKIAAAYAYKRRANPAEAG